MPQAEAIEAPGLPFEAKDRKLRHAPFIARALECAVIPKIPIRNPSTAKAILRKLNFCEVGIFANIQIFGHAVNQMWG